MTRTRAVICHKHDDHVPAGLNGITLTSGSMSTCQGRSPLPASLTALRLESERPIDLGELVSGRKRLSAAAAPMLTVSSAEVYWSLRECTTGEMNSCSASSSAGFEPSTVRLASELPAGFSALEMQNVRHLHIDCGTALQVASPADAARALCLLLSNAPASYRRLSLCFHDCTDVHLDLLAPVANTEHDESASHDGYTLDSFDDVQELVELLQDCVATHGLSVSVDKGPGVGGPTVLSLHRAE